ncbi:MAG TPA: hypothetical protein VGI30_01875 [Caulobacteraceae bacterium]
MHTDIKKLLVGVAALATTAALAPAAWAGCGAGLEKQPATWTSSGSPLALTRVDYTRPAITGLWSVTLTAAGSPMDNDWGFSEWHSDGTEIMNSGGHSPASGNFCLGVWAQTGANTYHLNHWALSYVPSASPPYGTLAAKVNLKEDVSVGRTGDTFTGVFTIDVYLPNGTRVVHDHGVIIGQRVTPN